MHPTTTTVKPWTALSQCLPARCPFFSPCFSFSASIIHWNCQGARRRRPDLAYHHFFHRADIIALQETFLSPNTIFTIRNRHIFRSDRPPPARGGGILTAVNYQFSASLISQMSTPHVEFHIIGCSKQNFTFRLINLYCKHGIPSADSLNCIPIDTTIPHIIVGDFNATHEAWGFSTNKSGKHLLTWILDNNLCILNDSQATHIGNNGTLTAIDIALSSPSLAATCNWRTAPDPMGSDHFPIHLQFGTINPTPPMKLTYFDWHHFNTILHQNKQHMTEADNFQRIIDHAIQTSKKHYTLPAARLPWWTPACGFLRARMRRLLNTSKKKLDGIAWEQYKNYRHKLKHLLNKLQSQYWSKIYKQAAKTGNIYHIFRNLKQRTQQDNAQHLILTHNNQSITDPQSQANLFISHFFKTDHSQTEGIPFQDTQEHPLNQAISQAELQQAIQNSKNSAPGADGITSAIIKKMSKSNQQILLQLFNNSLRTGKIPTEWTHSIIVPILKPGKISTAVESYRPISLTSTLVKIMERILLRRLLQFTYFTKHIFHPDIHGYLPNRSCSTLLTQLHHDIQRAKKAKRFIYMVTLDIKDAYGSVWLNGLLTKLQAHGITGRLAYWIFQFLAKRTGQVKWRNTLSHHRTSCKGLPQGSVLSAFLFALYVSDLPQKLPPQVTCKIYADDFTILCTADTALTAHTLM